MNLDAALWETAINTERTTATQNQNELTSQIYFIKHFVKIFVSTFSTSIRNVFVCSLLFIFYLATETAKLKFPTASFLCWCPLYIDMCIYSVVWLILLTYCLPKTKSHSTPKSEKRTLWTNYAKSFFTLRKTTIDNIYIRSVHNT